MQPVTCQNWNHIHQSGLSGEVKPPIGHQLQNGRIFIQYKVERGTQGKHRKKQQNSQGTSQERWHFCIINVFHYLNEIIFFHTAQFYLWCTLICYYYYYYYWGIILPHSYVFPPFILAIFRPCLYLTCCKWTFCTWCSPTWMDKVLDKRPPARLFSIHTLHEITTRWHMCEMQEHLLCPVSHSCPDLHGNTNSAYLKKYNKQGCVCCV